MKADTILTNAAQLIVNRGVERDKEEGERSMERCVRSFNEMTGHCLTETDGWKFMMFLKMARMEGGAFKLDDYEDNVSYAALMAESAAKEHDDDFGYNMSECIDPFPTLKPDASYTEPPRETCVDLHNDESKWGEDEVPMDEVELNKAPDYDDYGVCPNCGENNAISIKDRTDGVPSEVETRCTKCSHVDYWAFGHYEIGTKA